MRTQYFTFINPKTIDYCTKRLFCAIKWRSFLHISYFECAKKEQIGGLFLPEMCKTAVLRSKKYAFSLQQRRVIRVFYVNLRAKQIKEYEKTVDNHNGRGLRRADDGW
jgi:hypothetical protein